MEGIDPGRLASQHLIELVGVADTIELYAGNLSTGGFLARFRGDCASRWRNSRCADLCVPFNPRLRVKERV